MSVLPSNYVVPGSLPASPSEVLTLPCLAGSAKRWAKGARKAAVADVLDGIFLVREGGLGEAKHWRQAFVRLGRACKMRVAVRGVVDGAYRLLVGSHATAARPAVVTTRVKTARVVELRGLAAVRPEQWRERVLGLPQGNLRRAAAAVVWWDFFSDRMSGQAWPHLDEWLGGKWLPAAQEPSRDELRAALVAVGYTERRAQRRLGFNGCWKLIDRERRAG